MSPFLPSWAPFGLNLWVAARLLPVFAKRGRLDRLLALATPGAGEHAYEDMSAAGIVAAVKASVARPWRMRGRRCLREGLLAFRYLSLAGHRPHLHFAVIPDSLSTPRPSAHCWVSVAGETIMNAPSQPMVDLFTYDGSRPVPAGQAGTAEVCDLD